MDRIQRTQEKFVSLFGGNPTVNEGSDPEFMRILQRFIFGEVCYVGSLDNATRELITITVLAVNQTLPQLKAHVGACLNVGLTPVEIRETIYQCAPFIGFPKTLNAISTMNEVFNEKGIALPLESCETVTEDNRYDRGLAIQAPIYGNGIADRYTWLPDAFSESVFKGKVTSVANLAVDKSRTNKAKVFPVEIVLNETDKRLAPGNTVSCRILVDKIDDVLFIPTEALMNESGFNFVYKKRATGYERVDVEIGQRNNDYVVITKGLAEGDEVALLDPFAAEEGTESGEKQQES